MIKRNSIFNILFFTSYFLLIANGMLYNIVVLSSILNVLSYFALGLLILKIILQINSYTKKEILYILLLMVIVLLVFWFSRDTSILKLFLVIIASKNIDFNYCIKADFYFRLVLFFTIILLNKFSLIPSIIIVRHGVIRDSLGFSHPNRLGMYALILLFEYLYINKFKKNIFTIFIPIITIILLDIIANSRTTEIIIFLVLLSVIIPTDIFNKIINNKIIKKIIVNSFFIFLLLSIVIFLSYYNRSDIGLKIDQILSGRLYFVRLFISNFRINIFGNNLNRFLSYGNTLDNAFYHILIRYGLITVILAIITFNKLFKLLYKNNSFFLVGILFLFLIFGLSENAWLRVENNVFMILFSLLLYKNNNKFLESEKITNEK